MTIGARITACITASLCVLLTLAAVLRPASARPKASPKTHNIAIKGFKFVPEKLEVAVGDTVIWTNEDIVPHVVSADKFHSKSMDKGENWSFRPKQKGEFLYICGFHPTMKAELDVH